MDLLRSMSLLLLVAWFSIISSAKNRKVSQRRWSYFVVFKDVKLWPMGYICRKKTLKYDISSFYYQGIYFLFLLIKLFKILIFLWWHFTAIPMVLFHIKLALPTVYKSLNISKILCWIVGGSITLYWYVICWYISTSTV